MVSHIIDPSRGENYNVDKKKNGTFIRQPMTVTLLERSRSLSRKDQGRSLSPEDQGRHRCPLEHSQSLSRKDLGGRSPSRDGSCAAFSDAIAVTFSFATAMVVSRLPAGCRVNAYTSHPLDSASATTSAYQCPPPLVRWRISSRLPLFPGWLLHFLWSHRLCLALPFVPQLPLASIFDPPSSFVHAGWLLRHILLHRLHLLTRCRLTCCLLRHLCLTSTSLPSLAQPFLLPPLLASRPSPASSNARCTVRSTGGGIANSHSSLLYGSHPPTHPPAPPHHHLYSSIILAQLLSFLFLFLLFSL
jgi:hypothetical protein